MNKENLLSVELATETTLKLSKILFIRKKTDYMIALAKSQIQQVRRYFLYAVKF